VQAATLAQLMWTRVGIRREEAALRSAIEQIRALQEWRPCRRIRRVPLEARNMLVLGGLVARSALQREESRGSHYRRDFPTKREEWRRHLEVSDGPRDDLPRWE
jgi:L-aspartate oxidase